ncbi:DNA binding domain-containing protein, excisionase family [Pedococcus dokdonensis]|uniref:DNA binding domain-containing protein, excisionase family n=1 Tax=Pedococcus dokdonensis TaxID=443156 RepID=A0A1H0LWH0_9MICO|nr:helix-turn-helix domain-containing protein [Pedococcus dokdonensis]SDO72475.1 DNA binding domain-containing protein, excisionase family [Pedococcus dokdonensis]
MTRRLATIVQAAHYLQVSDRTVSNYVGRGLFPAYRVPGKRSHYVDLNEVDAALAKVPRRTARPGGKAFGPKATIIALPAQAEVVQR